MFFCANRLTGQTIFQCGDLVNVIKMLDAEGISAIIRHQRLEIETLEGTQNSLAETVSQLKAEKNAARIIADDITLRIGAYFHSVESKRGVISDL